MNTKFFCNDLPKEKEIVQVIFSERNDMYASGYLADYHGDVIMDIENVIKRKKKRKMSVNKLIPLNKIVYAVLEEFDNIKRVGSVDISYINKDDTEHIERFKNNFKLKNSLFHICDVLELNFDEFWNNTIYPFIKQSDEDYLEYFVKNYNDLDIDDNIKQMIKERFESEISNIKYKKTISIVSTNGISLVKNMFDQVIQNYDNLNIRYISTPNYLIESDTEEQLNNFIEELNANKPDGVFVKS